MGQVILLFMLLCLSAPVSAQDTLVNSVLTNSQMPEPIRSTNQIQDQFWRDEVDINTPWGQWLDGTQSYWFQMSEAMKNTIFKTAQMDITNITPADIIKRLDEAQIAFHKAQQKITPPEGLKKYHQKNLEISAAIVSDIPDHTRPQEIIEMRKRLSKEAHSELVTALLQHRVPLEIIEDFTNRR